MTTEAGHNAPVKAKRKSKARTYHTFNYAHGSPDSATIVATESTLKALRKVKLPDGGMFVDVVRVGDPYEVESTVEQSRIPVKARKATS